MNKITILIIVFSLLAITTNAGDWTFPLSRLFVLDESNTVTGETFFYNPVWFYSNVTLVSVASLSINDSLVLTDWDGNVNILLNATGHSFFRNPVNFSDVNVTGGLYVRDESTFDSQIIMQGNSIHDLLSSLNTSLNNSFRTELTLFNGTIVRTDGALQTITGDKYFQGTLTADRIFVINLSVSDATQTKFNESIAVLDRISQEETLVLNGSGMSRFTNLVNFTDVNISGGMYVRDNVGIGTTTPNHKLEVNGGINASALNISGEVILASNSGSLTIPTLISCDTIDTHANGTLYCGSDTGGSGDKWDIDNVFLNNVTNILTFNGSLLNETINYFDSLLNTSLNNTFRLEDTNLNISIRADMVSSTDISELNTSINNSFRLEDTNLNNSVDELFIRKTGGHIIGDLNITTNLLVQGLTNVSDLNVTGGLYVRDKASFDSQIIMQGNSIHDLLSSLNTSLNNSFRLEDINLNSTIVPQSWGNVTNGEWITPSYVVDIDDEDVETDLNTYVDVGGDEIIGDLNISGVLKAGGNDLYEILSWLNTSLNNTFRLEDTNLNNSMKIYANAANASAIAWVTAQGYGAGGGGAGGAGLWINTSTGWTSINTSSAFNDINISGVVYVNGTSGNVGVNTTAPTQTLAVVGTLNVTGGVVLAGKGEQVWVGTPVYDSVGKFNIQLASSFNSSSLANAATAINIQNTDKTGSNSIGLKFRDSNTVGVGAFYVTSIDHTLHYSEMHFDTRGPSGWNSDALVINHLGNVGINNSNPTAALHVIGDIVGTTKNFEITHPLNDSMLLRHGSLEGPEHGVYYRGSAILKGLSVKVTLPDYYDALTMNESYTVVLTAKGSTPYLLSYDNFDQKQFTVYGDKNNGQFDWRVEAARADVGALEVEYAAPANDNHIMGAGMENAAGEK